MKIVIVAHNLRVAGGLSVGKNIVKTLPEIAPMHEYLMIVADECGYPDFIGVNNVEVIKCPSRSLFMRMVFEKREMRRTISYFKPDWIWCLGNLGLSDPFCRQSVLFHSSHHIYPSKYYGYNFAESIRKRLTQIPLQRWMLKRGFQASSNIYCQTQTAAKRLSRFFGISPVRLGICPNAFTHSLKKTIYDLHLQKAYKDKFVLFTLTKYYAHKNLERIVELFKQYYIELEDVVCLIPIDRSQGKRANKLIDRIEQLNLSRQVICTGNIPQEQLNEYFRAADVMFLPTLLESFSGTYLEAMAFETPILTSDLDFAREICGEAAAYIDPFSFDSMLKGILRIKNDSTYRNELIRRGNERIKNHLKAWPEILRDVLDQEGIEHA